MTRNPLAYRLLAPALIGAALALAAPTGALADEAPAAAPAPTGEGAQPTAPEATAPSVTTTAPAPTSPAGEAEAQAPEVTSEHAQGPSVSGSRPRARPHAGQTAEEGGGEAQEGEGASSTGGARTGTRAPSPSALTPSLPLSLRASIAGVPAFFIESFQVPPFLLPIFQAAGTAYGIPWQVLAAINEVETDYGRDLSVSSAGAEGWMQFLPAEWSQYGVDANGDGFKDPYNPADAIFAAARYLRAAGGADNVRAAVFSYDHSQEYVDSVMLRAQLLGGTPPELLGAVTGLTESHFPVHAPSHFTDGFPTISSGTGPPRTVPGTTIYSQAGAPVIAVQDGEVVQVGDSRSLGHFVSLRDAYGNTYVYSQLGDVARVYPVLKPHVHSAVSSRISSAGHGVEPAPDGPATAGAQPRSPISQAATVSSLALGAAAGLEGAATSPAPVPVTPIPAPVPASPLPARPGGDVREFTEGANDVYLRPLVAGVQVIAGTVLGHLGDGTSATADGVTAPHLVFQIRPAGQGAQLIDPKPILDGWVSLENTSVFRAKGENPFLATSPTVGQVLLESKQQLAPQVLHDHGIRLARCAREDVQSGKVDKRVLAMLEYLSVSGLRPTVSGLPCTPPPSAGDASNAAAAAASETVQITAVDGTPILGHQGPGTIADTTVRKLLTLQGLSRPRRIVSQMSYPGAAGAVSSRGAADAIRVSFASPGGASARAAGVQASGLTPEGWIKLIARLGEIPDPTVGSGHSSASMPDSPDELAAAQRGHEGGHR